jgi:hypothetical protein
MVSPAGDAVNMDNRIVAVAARLGRFAATLNQPLTSCPYTEDDADAAALRRVWLTHYLRVRPPAAGSVSYDGDDVEDVDASEAARRPAGPVAVVLTETGSFEMAQPDDVEDDSPLTEAEFALLVALTELDGSDLAEVFDAAQGRYPKGHPKGGQWRPMADRIKDSIAAHRRGEHGDKHPLEGYNREQLRRVARARGIELARGESRDSIAAKLIGHFDDGGKNDEPKPKAPTAKAKAPAVKLAAAPEPPAKTAREPSRFAAPFHRNLDGIEDLAAAVDDGYPPKRQRKLTGGVSAETELVTLKGGRQVVHKSGGNPDAEQASSMISDAIGAGAPRVYRDSQSSVYMDYLDDAESGAMVRHRMISTESRQAWQDHIAKLAATPSGKLIGLLDLMTVNGDRNDGNYMITSGGDVKPIDHGHTFGVGTVGIGNRRPRAFPVRTTFSAQLVSRDGRKFVPNDFDPAEIQAMRGRLEQRRPDFDHIGRGGWLDYALVVLDEVGKNARGGSQSIEVVAA